MPSLADCKQHRLWGAKHTCSTPWLMMAFFCPFPLLIRLQSLCQDQTPVQPQEPEAGRQPFGRTGSCLSSASDLSNKLLLGEKRLPAEEHQGRGEREQKPLGSATEMAETSRPQRGTCLKQCRVWKENKSYRLQSVLGMAVPLHCYS